MFDTLYITCSRNGMVLQVEVLLSELSGLFPEGLVHLGGDEVDDTCWKVNSQQLGR